jgi:hypothetical protein
MIVSSLACRRLTKGGKPGPRLLFRADSPKLLNRCQKWSAPAGHSPNRGCRCSPMRRSSIAWAFSFGKRTCKPNSVQDSHPGAVIPLGEALPLALISDLPGGSDNCSSRLAASGRCAAGAWLFAPASLPIWSCSVWGLPCRRHYCRRGALLPHLFTLTTAWGRPLEQLVAQPKVCPAQRRYVFCGTSRPRALKRASRTLSGTLPCGVRTFLSRNPFGAPAATARSSCQWIV